MNGTRTGTGATGRAARRRGAIALALTIATLGVGCAGSMTRVDQDSRDTSGAYDGTYRLKLAERPRGFQNVGQWQMRCGTTGFDYPVSVVGGSARLQVQFDSAESPTAPVQSYVDERGRFRFEVPVENRATATGTSSVTLDNGAMKLIYQGRLEADGASRGTYTVGIAEFGYAGCSYPFEIVPEGA